MSNYTPSLFDLLTEPKLTPAEIAPQPSVVLRPYQEEAVANVFAEWESGSAATLVSLPTGTGKSVVFSEVMRRLCRGSRA